MDRAQNLADLSRTQAALRPQHTALVQDGERRSYLQLDQAASQVAQALLARGWGGGTRVAYLGKDALQTIELVFGCAKAGAVLLGINWRLTAREVAFILADSGARLLVVGAEFAARFEAAGEELPELEQVLVLGSSYEAFVAAAASEDPGLPVSPEDVVVQMYTSGTTGRPKGVCLAHRSFFAVVASMQDVGDPWIGWGPEDVSLCNIPTFHIGGLWWAVTGLNAGATNVLMDTFVGWRLLELIESERVTKVCMVPAMIQVALAEPGAERADFSSLRHLVYGGSPIPRTLLARALRTFGCELVQIYGLTETGNTAVCLRGPDHLDPESERLKAAGRPYPGVRVRIVDGDGCELGTREVGEIQLHSPANMVEYWKRPEASARTLVDGWIHTGDAGYLDEDGFLYVHDRIKDMVLYAGENVYPAEIESVLCAHPAVREAAVIGVPDERWGELVKAIVVRRPEVELRARELLAFAREELADFKVPKSVEFVDALPRTPSGKIKKAELREPYWAGRERRV